MRRRWRLPVTPALRMEGRGYWGEWGRRLRYLPARSDALPLPPPFLLIGRKEGGNEGREGWRERGRIGKNEGDIPVRVCARACERDCLCVRTLTYLPIGRKLDWLIDIYQPPMRLRGW